jgi:hypothetical protein
MGVFFVGVTAFVVADKADINGREKSEYESLNDSYKDF